LVCIDTALILLLLLLLLLRLVFVCLISISNSSIKVLNRAKFTALLVITSAAAKTFSTPSSVDNFEVVFRLHSPGQLIIEEHFSL
jgi:hypothetical protein